jgi:asparagine synthase (glutamine-hydrolysing)
MDAARLDDDHLLIEHSAQGMRVIGSPRKRIDQPWPRDPSSADAFAEWQWDGVTLVVTNDAGGFQPLYYLAASDRVAVSPSIGRLLSLGIPTELDDRALSVFLRLGYFIGDDTPFRHIRALRGGSRLTWRAGAFSVRSSVVPPRPQTLTRAALLDGYLTLFERAVERRLPTDGQRAGVPLSGGRDSRHLLFQLQEYGCAPLITATVQHYPPRGNEDAEIAGQVAAAAGVSHVTLRRNRRPIRAERRKNDLTGFCTDEHVQFLPMIEYFRQRADVLYDGIAGDVLSRASQDEYAPFIALLNAGKYEDLAGRLLASKCDEPALARVLQPAVRPRFSLDAARAHLAVELQRHADWPHPWAAFWLANRTAREIALSPFVLLARAGRVMTPYLDRDFVEFLMALPTSSLVGTSLHTEAIARRFPQYAHIGYEDKHSQAGPSPWYYRRLALDLMRETLRRRSPPVVNRGRLRSQLLRAVVRGLRPPFQFRRALLLMQLEEVLDRASSLPSG